MTTEKLTKEIEALDAEARTALDRLANKREELERQHQAGTRRRKAAGARRGAP